MDNNNTVYISVTMLDSTQGEPFKEMDWEIDESFCDLMKTLTDGTSVRAEADWSHYELRGNWRFADSVTQEENRQVVLDWLADRLYNGLQLEYVEQISVDKTHEVGRIQIKLDRKTPKGYTIETAKQAWTLTDYAKAHEYVNLPEGNDASEWAMCMEAVFDDVYCSYWGSPEFDELPLTTDVITGML